LTELLQEVILLAAGFHQHARGEWRKRRAMTAQTTAQAPPAPAQPPTEQSGDLWQRLKTLADRAQKGDASALPEIRQILDARPEV
jgi:hypothetical protein